MRRLLSRSTALLLIIGLSTIPSVLTLPNHENISSFGTIDYTPTGSVTYLPRLGVTGNKIVAKGTNKQVWLRGINFGFTSWSWDGRGTRQQIQHIASWKCNIIRYTINPTEWMNDPNVRSKMDSLIKWGGQEGIYTQLNYYSGKGASQASWTAADWRAWRNWWEDVAMSYQGNTNVLYCILNEPYGISASKWQTEARACIDAIRAIDSDVIIVLEALSETSWYDIALNYEQTNPISRSNIVFAIHKYYRNESWEYSKSSIRSYLTDKGMKWLIDNNRVAMTNEFNYDVDVAPNNGPTWMRNWMEVMDEDGYSGFKAWWWNTGEWTRLLADWNGNPSASGSVLQEYLI